eukprot:CAMPEP_0170308142 /NCGR_PEP_ID=MMETSP0116_2-20130129/54503_1 /TAXON_ID=400756 /ORGANISM="Durinskia baltica, Strain CSIRO CS-38" /LENGTH=45 /DNA_ID= /DNA_START= /DNA_END= /DNA_ORIENTATION=
MSLRGDAGGGTPAAAVPRHMVAWSLVLASRSGQGVDPRELRCGRL